LLARGEHPQAIVSTLITQFRTWLWVKSAIEGGMKKDMDIAQLCGVGNPKRMYFLRQEVRTHSLVSLSQVLTKLLDLEIDLNKVKCIPCYHFPDSYFLFPLPVPCCRNNKFYLSSQVRKSHKDFSFL
jgi:hypothetical protein